MKLFSSLLLALLPASLLAADHGNIRHAKKPLKIFLMVGQSNMQGHGHMVATDDKTGKPLNGTLDWMIETYPHQYSKLKTKQGDWAERQDVWIAYNRQWIGNVRAEINQHGPLTAGYGGDPPQQGQHMGPELGFGWTVGDAMKEQVLLLKIAWGGRSLAVDFRPPSSGGTTGLYYENVIANTFKTLSKLDQLFPEYSGNYELAGFVWHQGWNDGCDLNMTKEYEVNLANLIRDVRTDLGIPNLPVSIGVSGMNGADEDRKTNRREDIINAQFAVADPKKYPEFAGTVAAVETRSFWRPPFPNGSPGQQGYHWNNNCETYWLVGKAMAKGMLKLIQGESSSGGNMQAEENEDPVPVDTQVE